MKVVSKDKERFLRREFEALTEFKDSKFFVKLLHDKLLSSTEFSVSASPSPSPSSAVAAGSQTAVRFDNHIAMVMEKGVVNLDQFLLEHGGDLYTADYLQIIGSAFNIVKEAHQKKIVLLDLKGSNLILFDAGRGLRVWKGIDLDGALLEATSLDDNSFMATIPFMAPELLTSKLSTLKVHTSMDVWSLGILTFNVLVASQFRTFWTKLGLYNDTDIKDEIISGRFTQERVDAHINSTFPGHANSSQRHLLQRMLKIRPSERFAISALVDNAAYLSGVASISTSTLHANQQHIISELKSMQETFQSHFTSFRTVLETVLEDDSGTDLGHSSSYLQSLQSALDSQLQSAANLKAVTESLSQWKSPADATMSPAFMSMVTSQLQQLFSAASEQKIDAAMSQELIRHLSSEVSGVQGQVQAFRNEITALHDSFLLFGECVRKELAQNSQKHALVVERLTSIDRTVATIFQEQMAAKGEAENRLQELQQVRLQLIKLKLSVSEIETNIAMHTQLLHTIVENIHDVPILFVLIPVTAKGVGKLNPMNMIVTKAKLVFICGYTMQLVGCGYKGDGYTVTNLTSLARKALPLLKLGLMLLQIGLLSTGIPIPLAGMAGTALAQAEKMSYLRSAASLLDDKAALDSVGSCLDSAAAMDKVSRTVRDIEVGDNRENIRSAMEVVSAFLKSEDPFLKYLGLTKEISRSGKVAWVKNDAEVIRKFKEL